MEVHIISFIINQWGKIHWFWYEYKNHDLKVRHNLEKVMDEASTCNVNHISRA